MAPRSLTRAVVFPATSTAAGGGAPSDATYITQTANGTLSAEQALASLTTGVLKVTTGTGVLSTATEGTDYYKPGGTDVAIADGGTGQSTATLGFNALSPVTTRGDLIYRDATNNARLAKGTAGQFLTIGANDPAWAAGPVTVMNAATGDANGIAASAGAVVYFGGNFFSDASATETLNGALVIPVSGTVRAIGVIMIVLGTAGTAAENWQFDLRLYDSSGTLQTTVTGPAIDAAVGASKMKTAMTTGLSTAVTAGWIWRIRITQPASFTATPTTIFPSASIYIDTP